MEATNGNFYEKFKIISSYYNEISHCKLFCSVNIGPDHFIIILKIGLFALFPQNRSL